VIYAWRIDKASRKKQDSFSGMGAHLTPGRWNSLGTALVYTASSLSLAALEKFIHLGEDGGAISFVSYAIEIPDTIAKYHIGGLIPIPPRLRACLIEYLPLWHPPDRHNPTNYLIYHTTGADPLSCRQIHRILSTAAASPAPRQRAARTSTGSTVAMPWSVLIRIGKNEPRKVMKTRVSLKPRP